MDWTEVFEDGLVGSTGSIKYFSCHIPAELMDAAKEACERQGVALRQLFFAACKDFVEWDEGQTAGVVRELVVQRPPLREMSARRRWDRVRARQEAEEQALRADRKTIPVGPLPI